MLKYFKNRLSAMSQKRRGGLGSRYVDLASGLPFEYSAICHLQQGDVVDLLSVPLKWVPGGDAECVNGVVIITQTCDLVRHDRAEVQVVPIVELVGSAASQALTGRQPRYASLPALGERWFADLSLVATAHKCLVLKSFKEHGLDPADDAAIRNFSQAIGRRFNRFAFPDEVTPWIKPLQDILRSRAMRPGSPIARPVRSIDELRLEASGGWGSGPPFDLTLIVIVPVGVLAEIDEGIPLPIVSGQRSVAEVARSMPSDDASNVAVLAFWEEFGDALARHCKPPDDSSDAIKAAVRSINAEVISEDELTYARVRRSVEIDLDHLSAPGPV